MRWPWSRRRKVFGIGLNKTGTTTLGTCLKRLGYRHCGYRRDLLEAFRSGDVVPAIRATRDFDAFDDWPWPLLYRELHEKFGDNARFVLTVRRDPETWLGSLKRHSLRTPPHSHARRFAYGFDYPHGYEAEHIAFYERHNEDVRRYFKGKEHLLLEVCWENGVGWRTLCDFLGDAVPDEPFPHAYSADEADARADDSHRAINQQLIEAQIAALASGRTAAG